jgi:hypothetical protein
MNDFTIICIYAQMPDFTIERRVGGCPSYMRQNHNTMVTLHQMFEIYQRSSSNFKSYRVHYFQSKRQHYNNKPLLPLHSHQPSKLSIAIWDFHQNTHFKILLTSMSLQAIEKKQISSIHPQMLSLYPSFPT